MDKSELIPICHKSLIAYAMAQSPEYRAADHHRLIAEALERVKDGTCTRLIINMPPRHGKSMLVSEFFPAWYFGHHPARQILHASYGQDMVDGFGRKIRNQLKDDLYGVIFPTARLSDDSQAANKFNTTKGGAYFAVGVGGSATGRGAHLLLIDDPIKDRAEADSETLRNQLKDWYSSVGYTRLMKPGAIVIVQTRWHPSDLAGWLIDEHAHENWEVLNLPAIAEENTPDEAALWEEFFPLEQLHNIRTTLIPRDWSALYQQRPVAATGGDFKRAWLNHYDSVASAQMPKIILVDPSGGRSVTAGGKRKGDFTTMWVVGLGTDDNYYVLDCIRDRLNLTARADALFGLHRKWRPTQTRYEQYGMQSDIEHIKSEMNRRSYRFSITEVGGGVKKEDRIRRLVPLFQKGQMWLPHELPYTDAEGQQKDLIKVFVEDEYMMFDASKHDDMLDSLSRIAEPKVDLPWPNKMVSGAPVVQFEVLDSVCGY